MGQSRVERSTEELDRKNYDDPDNHPSVQDERLARLKDAMQGLGADHFAAELERLLPLAVVLMNIRLPTTAIHLCSTIIGLKNNSRGWIL